MPKTTAASEFRIDSASPKETQQLATRLAPLLDVGHVVLFVADLGAGKTTFINSVASFLKVEEGSTSPTFIIVQTLNGKRGQKPIPIHHMDFYRLNKNELINMGIQDYFGEGGAIPRGLVLVEWADRFKEIWPKERLEVHITIEPKTKKRQFLFRGLGPAYIALVKKLKSK